MADAIEGGCYCQAVRYRLARAPSESLLCHCQTCRRVSAAPMVGWVTVTRGDLLFTRGEPACLHSSPGVERTFCAACGTPLTYVRRDQPATIDITTCSLDDPSAFPPTYHSWVSHDLAWMRSADALPSFAQAMPGD